MSEFRSHDLADLGGLLREVAGNEIMPRFGHLPASAVRTKSGPLDLVTAADEAAEAAITAGLERRFPGAIVIGEEATSANPGLLGELAEAELAFVVDPIDGTANFAAGVPLFGVMAAAIARGEVIAAAIHDPISDDTAAAMRGEGAWIEAADGTRRRLRVADSRPTEQMTGIVSWRFLPPQLRQTVCTNLPRFASVWDYRCAAHAYRVLAQGHCDFVLFYRLMPWDHAPGWLLHREAGGYAARFDGTPYRPTDTSGGLICAPDETSFEAARATLLEAHPS
jgi:fructose-1,6-bisphosphatase/inositol monophosphatase family enzyme